MPCTVSRSISASRPWPASTPCRSATDVLAFPMDELRPGKVNEEPEEGVLGDLVLSPSVAERQGVEAGHGREAEIDLLTVHGILHLLGYDHAEPEEHAVMFGLQGELLEQWRSTPEPA